MDVRSGFHLLLFVFFRIGDALSYFTVTIQKILDEIWYDHATNIDANYNESDFPFYILSDWAVAEVIC
mgnify:CR=1 FL=1